MHSGFIEDQQRGAIEVDFANKFIGGGALYTGCVQVKFFSFLVIYDFVSKFYFNLKNRTFAEENLSVRLWSVFSIGGNPVVDCIVCLAHVCFSCTIYFLDWDFNCCTSAWHCCRRRSALLSTLNSLQLCFSCQLWLIMRLWKLLVQRGFLVMEGIWL